MQLTPKTGTMAQVWAPTTGQTPLTLQVVPPLSAAKQAALAGQPLTVVGQGTDGKVMLETSTGQRLEAVLVGNAPGARNTPPVPAGGQAAPVVPGPGEGITAPVAVKITPGMVLTLAPASPTAGGKETGTPDAAGTLLRVVVNTTGRAMPQGVGGPQGVQQTGQQPVLPVPQAGAVVGNMAALKLQLPQVVGGTASGAIAAGVGGALLSRPLPAGPLDVVFEGEKAPPTVQAGQPLVLTVTGQPKPVVVSGSPVMQQAGQVQAAPVPQRGGAPLAVQPQVPTPPVPVQVQGLRVPVGTALPVVVLAGKEGARPVVLQTTPVAMREPMVNGNDIRPTGGTPAPLPPLPLLVVLTPEAGVLPAEPGRMLARVLALAPVPAGAANKTPDGLVSGGQPILLANGQRGVVQSGGVIPEGSTLVVDIPSLTSAPTVVQVLPAGGQGAQPQGAVPGMASVAPLQTAAPVLPVGVVVRGVISGQNAQGQLEMILAEPAPLAGQTVTLAVVPSGTEKPLALTPGTLLHVQVQADGTAVLLEAHMPPAVEKAGTVALLGQQWGALTKALAVLQQQAPAQAAALQAQLPRVENLMPGLAHVMHAIQTGRMEDFAGPQLAALLRATAPELQGDMQTLQHLQNRTETGAQADAAAWRGTLFPYVESALDKEPRQGRFFWRREQSDDPRGKAPTRFVVELSLSQTGPVQLDGLVQYPGMWMKLRRTTPVEDGFTEGLQALVAGLLEAYGMTGGVRVEVAPTFAVDPTREILAASPDPLPTKA